MNYEVESCLWNDIHKRRKHLKSIFSASEHHEIVTKQIVVLENIANCASILELLKLLFGSLSVVELEVIASLKIDSDDRIGVQAKIHREDFQRNVVVIHLVVTKRNVNVNCVEFFVLDQKFLVDLSRLFKVRTQVMQRCHAKLVLD